MPNRTTTYWMLLGLLLIACGEQLTAADIHAAALTHREPLQAPDRTWTYVEFPETRCRDGSEAGISLSLNSNSKKVLIYLEGGVYCLDALTCALNPSNVDDLLFNSAKIEPRVGIFDRDNPLNPVRDWNIVYVPYCSGDAMGGTRDEPVDVPGGPARQYFSGHSNMQRFLERIQPTFPDATDVVLTGMSAGASSALLNMNQVQRAFPTLKVRYVIDSSLPPLSAASLAPCLQDRMRELWGLDDGPLVDCGASCSDPHDYWRAYALFVAQSFADRPAGFIDAIEDGMMRSFCGIGFRECRGSLLFDSLPARDFRNELLSFREAVKSLPSYGTFYPAGEQHTWLKSDSFYTGKAGDELLVDWVGRIVTDQAPGHFGP
jgi:hypothetical protein